MASATGSELIKDWPEESREAASWSSTPPGNPTSRCSPGRRWAPGGCWPRGSPSSTGWSWASWPGWSAPAWWRCGWGWGQCPRTWAVGTCGGWGRWRDRLHGGLARDRPAYSSVPGIGVDPAKIAILAASLVAGLGGTAMLFRARRNREAAQELSGATADIKDPPRLGLQLPGKAQGVCWTGTNRNCCRGLSW
jgi:hypothetical protein